MILKRTSLILILIFSTTLTFAQNKDRWTAGSASQLKGNVVNLICFINTPANPWKNFEKEEVLYKIQESNNWIENQGKNYGINLNIQNHELGNVVFDEIETGTGSGKERVDWIYRTMHKLGYKNSKQALRKLKKKYKADNIQVILIANEDGRSYSMNYGKGMNKKKYIMEGLLLYKNYENGAPLPITSVTAHEILHLYGAWDLYSTFNQTKDREKLARELYPNDIMLRVDHNMTSLNIDKLTAWLIGWNTTDPENFNWFRPKGTGK